MSLGLRPLIRVKVIPLNILRNVILSRRFDKICLVLFLLLVTLHYCSCRPLWLDEGLVRNNLESLTTRQLFGPLLHGQAFPRAYLAVIQGISRPFHYHVLALRWLPLLAMIAGYLIWTRVLRESFRDKTSCALAVLTLTCSYPFSYYAAELKPYSLDVLTSGLFALFLLRLARLDHGIPTSEDYWATGGLLGLLFVSYAALFFCGLVVWQLGRLVGRNKKVLPLGLFYLGGLIAALLVVNHIDLRFGRGEKTLASYWESYFICRESFACFLETFWEGVRRLATWFFGRDKFFMQWASFAIPFFLYSLVRYGYPTWKSQRGVIRTVGDIGGLVLFELFVFGVLKIYPFTGERITFFLAPFVFYFVIRGYEDLRRWPWVHGFFIWHFVVFLIASYLYSGLGYIKLYLS